MRAGKIDFDCVVKSAWAYAGWIIVIETIILNIALQTA